MKRRLFLLAVIVLTGYLIGRADAAYGHAPWIILALVAAVSWLAGYGRAALPLTLAVAEAHRERDQLAARVAQLEDGGTYTPIPLDTVRARAMAAHPSNLHRLPRQDQR